MNLLQRKLSYVNDNRFKVGAGDRYIEYTELLAKVKKVKIGPATVCSLYISQYEWDIWIEWNEPLIKL